MPHAIRAVDRAEDIRLAAKNVPARAGARIALALNRGGKVSMGIFQSGGGPLVRTLLRGETLSVGEHVVHWDGLDNRGRAVRAGRYEWRAVTSRGLTARYVTTIGINPPGGEAPEPRRSWVGDHLGAGLVDVDESGFYVASPLTEGMMMLVKVDRAMSTIVWTRPQFYQGGRLSGIAATGRNVFMAHPNGRLRRLDHRTGRVEAEWRIDQGGSPPGDIDARGKNLVIVYPDKGVVRWLSMDNGKAVGEVRLPGARCAAAIGEETKGDALVAAGRVICRVGVGRQPEKVASLGGDITALDYDGGRKELWAVVGDHKVVRLDSAFNASQTYSEKARPPGPFDPTRFAGVRDVAADLRGGFLIGEPTVAPRRIARVNRDGSIARQWFGGMSFYVNATVDPADPQRIYGIAPEGWINVYRIDYGTGRWEIEACYRTGLLGDSLFPFASSFRAVRKNGQLHLYHRVVPAVIRLDAAKREAVPVAIAGRVLNRGRTFFQLAGTGKGGYPTPWAAAAEHHGYRDLRKAPTLYSWADTDGQGDFDPEEFRFYPKAKGAISFHNPGDFAADGDYIGSAGINATHAMVRLPVSRWEGPARAAPRWDWDKLEPFGRITADACGYGSPRGLSVAPDGSISVAYQAGIMIRGHGQYEGGGWPEAAMRGSRILGFDAKGKAKFVVGRQSKSAAEANTGVLYYPMQMTTGPNRCVIVNDQTKQSAQVWTHDGLYVGALLESRAADDRNDGFYRVHGDDNQGATVFTARNGRTYWLMPYVGHNRLYEITGWDTWRRLSGPVARPDVLPSSPTGGRGLTGRYVAGGRTVLETVECPIYYNRFGREGHADKVKAPYKAVWTGFVRPPLSDRYRFNALLGKDEQVAVWIDGKVVHASGGTKGVNRPVDLTAGHAHRIRVEYVNQEGRAELKLLWSSRVLDPAPLSPNILHPNTR